MAPSSSSILHWLPFSPLGSGSFGHVSLALNLHDGSLFAAKSSPSPSSSSLLALHNELHILQSLHSPFILRCLGSDFSSSQPGALHHIFLEYMDSGSLADLLRRSGGKLQDESLVKHYTRAILQGLDYLHQNGIVHCDIKSHNILIGSSGIKIADFGAARRVDEASELDGTIRGTPLWMAPEVIQGEEQGTASDIWSLGCTVVEMLQGRPPWGDVSNLAALLFKVGGSKEEAPLPEAISEEARDFLLRCLEREPKERATAEELMKHPFVRGWEYEGKGNPGSPRSTLDVWQSESESEWECETMISSGQKMVASVCSRRESKPPTSDVQERSEWVTVRQAEGWCERKQQQVPVPVPFMQTAAAAAAIAGEAPPPVRRRACEVSLDCAKFLQHRRTTTVG